MRRLATTLAEGIATVEG